MDGPPPRYQLRYQPLQEPFRDALYVWPPRPLPVPTPEPVPGPVDTAFFHARTATLAVLRNAARTGRFISSFYNNRHLRLILSGTRNLLTRKRSRNVEASMTPRTTQIEARRHAAREYAMKRVRLTCPGAWPMTPPPEPERQPDFDEDYRRRKTPQPTPDVQGTRRIFDSYVTPTPQPDGMLNRASMSSHRQQASQIPQPEGQQRPQDRHYLKPKSPLSSKYNKQASDPTRPSSHPDWYVKVPSSTSTSTPSLSPEAQRPVRSPTSPQPSNVFRVPSPTPTSSSGVSNGSGVVLQSIEEDYTLPQQSPLQYRSANEHVSTPHPRVQRIIWAEQGRSEPPKQRDNAAIVSRMALKRGSSNRHAPYVTMGNTDAHPPKRRSPTSSSSNRVTFNDDDEHITSDSSFKCHSCGAKNRLRSKKLMSILKKTRPNKYHEPRAYGPGVRRNLWQEMSSKSKKPLPEVIQIDEDGYDHDMGSLPEAPSPHTRRGKYDPNSAGENRSVSWQPSYKHGLEHPRPLYYNEEDATNQPLDQHFDDQLFTKHRGDVAPSASPLKSDVDPSPVKLPAPEETPVKNDSLPAHTHQMIEKVRNWESITTAENAYRKVVVPRPKGLQRLLGQESEQMEAEIREQRRVQQEEYDAAIRKEEIRQDEERRQENEKHEARVRAANYQTKVAQQTEQEEIQAGRDAEADVLQHWKSEYAVQLLDEDTKAELDRLLADFEYRKSNRLTYETTTVAKDNYITYRELETIFSGIGWLNDEAVNKFIGDAVALSLKNEGYVKSKSAEGPPVHAFSSAMWSTYQDKGFEGVKRWFKRARVDGKNLLNAEGVFVPINTGGHWILLVIFGRRKEFAIFDSMEPQAANIRKEYKDFASGLIKGALGEDYKEDEWHMATSASRQQNNGSDCGVFVCVNALAVIRGYKPWDVVFGGHEEMIAARNMIGGVLIRNGFEAAGVGF